MEDDWDVAPETLKTLTAQFGDMEHPLFMEDTSCIDHSDALQALHEIYREGDKTEVAQNCKNQGNEAMREARFDDAVIFYTHGIDVQAEDAKLVAVLHCNRAQAYLQQREYVACIVDCKKAVTLDEGMVKAYQRGALASTMQGLYPQALHFVERGLVQHPEDSLLMQLKSDAEAKAEMQALRVAANRERHQQQEVAVQTMLDVRGITLEPDSPYSREISKPKVFDGGLQWSLFFVIDRVSTVEVVHDVSEQWFLDAQLELLFAQPTSWNPNGEYSLDNSVCYYEGDNLTPINTHAPLGMVLEVVQKVKGVPTFRVVLVCDDKEFQTNQKIERCL